MSADSKELENSRKRLEALAERCDALAQDRTAPFSRGFWDDEVAAFIKWHTRQAADIRLILSTNEALARENERLREALKECCDAMLSVDGHLTVPEDAAGWESLELYDAYFIARLALEPSHDEGVR